MRASLQRNVSEIAITEIKTAAPAFVVVEIRERSRSRHFVPVIGFCFGCAISTLKPPNATRNIIRLTPKVPDYTKCLYILDYVTTTWKHYCESAPAKTQLQAKI